MEPWDVVNSQGDGPYAIRSLLGWVINGSAEGYRDGESGYPSVHVNRTTVAWFIKLKGVLLKLSKIRKELQMTNAITMGMSTLELTKEMQTLKNSLGNVCLWMIS